MFIVSSMVAGVLMLEQSSWEEHASRPVTKLFPEVFSLFSFSWEEADKRRDPNWTGLLGGRVK